MYDIMRTLKDVHVRTAYGTIVVRPDGTSEVELFVHEAEGGCLTDM